MEGIVCDSLVKTFKAKALKVLGISISVRREHVLKALDGVSVSIHPGEVVGVIGPNGAGKTTLMGCLLGFLHADSGQVVIDGMDPNEMRVRKLIGYVPERLNFPATIPLHEFIEMHYDLALQPPEHRKKRVGELLESVGLEEAKWKLPIGKCSRGMLQRAALAQALVGQPKYLFLDEPTSGIDPGGVLEITKILKRLKQQGVTMVLNSHQLDQVEKVCDRTIFVSKGRVTLGEELQSAVQEHVFLLRFATPPPEDALAKLGTELGLTLNHYEKRQAEFLIKTDADKTRLLRAVVNEGFELTEALPQFNKLEQLFSLQPNTEMVELQ